MISADLTGKTARRPPSLTRTGERDGCSASVPGRCRRLPITEGEDASKLAATIARLTQLRDADQLAAAHVRLAAEGMGASERTVWRRVAAGTRAPNPAGPPSTY
ncbi:hypothetical protein [Streptomyces sp. NPDC046261]|uniref:hypothetical protein n=1 Tax=Streptomyces sp. NPDC046261 TaxID=3157200 RepID=UPI0033C38399